MAADGPAGANSPFAAALVRLIGTAGVDIRSALTPVQQDVYDRTRGAQLPSIESGLPALFFAAPSGTPSERESLLAAMAGLSDDLRGQIERIAAARAMPLAPLYAAFLSAGLREAGGEERERRLAEAGDAWVQHHDRLRGLESFDSRVMALRAEAAEAFDLGETNRALAAYDRAIALDGAVAQGAAAVLPGRRVSEADSRALKAGTLRAALAYPEALAEYAEAVDLYGRAEDVAASERLPLDRAARERFALALQDMGDLHMTIGNSAAALAAFTRWETVARARLEEAPGDAGWRSDLTSSLIFLGGPHIVQGRLSEAMAAYTEALELARGLSASDPNNEELQRSLTVALNRNGDLHHLRGNLLEALVFYSEAQGIRRDLLTRNPDNARLRRDLSVSLNKTCLVRADLGDLPGARVDAEESLELSRALAIRTPSGVEAQRDLSVSLYLVGNVLVELGELSAALSAHVEGLVIRRGLSADDQRNTHAQRDMFLSLSAVCKVLQKQQDFSGALAACSEGLEFARNLAAGDPLNSVAQRELWGANIQLGDALFFRGDLAGARAAYEEGLALGMRLALTFPARDDRFDLVIASQVRLALVTDQPVRWLLGLLGNLKQLEAEGQPSAEREDLLNIVRTELARHGWHPLAAE